MCKRTFVYVFELIKTVVIRIISSYVLDLVPIVRSIGTSLFAVGDAGEHRLTHRLASDSVRKSPARDGRLMRLETLPSIQAYVLTGLLLCRCTEWEVGKPICA